MSHRVYVLLDIMDGESEQVTRTLQSRSGVVIVDALEGSPDVIMMIEASERKKLVELTMEALESVESMTEDVHLLPTQNESDTYGFSKPVRRHRKSLRDKALVRLDSA